MDRDLTRGEYILGVAGVGLVRLHRSRDVQTKSAILAEIQALLERLDDAPFSRGMLGEDLDLLRGYERWSGVYDLPGNPVIDAEQPIVWQLLDALEGEPVLDAACGTGRHLAHLLSQGRSVVGVDLSAGMLSKAAVRAQGINLHEGNLLALPVEDGSFAGAVCSLALEHVGDLPGAYAELARAIRPGGWLVVSTLHPTIRNVLGWGAWFVDDCGRGEVPIYRQRVSDHFNAAAGAGLHLVRMEEPLLDVAFFGRLAGGELPESEAPVATERALRDMPAVMVCQFALSAGSA